MSAESRLVWLICCLSFTAVRAQDPAQDDFERPSLGGDWTRISGSNAEIVNGSDLGAPTNVWLFVGWTASEFAADQFCEAVIANERPDTMLTQVYVRRRTNDLARYGFHFNDENGDGTGIANPRWEIKYDGVPTAQTRILASVPASMPQPGDSLSIEVRGTSPVSIRGLHNGVEVISAQDSAHQRIISSGMVGVVSRLRRGGYTAPPNSPVFASWRGGSLGPELRIRPAGVGSMDYILSFGTVSNRVYTLQWAEGFAEPQWNFLTSLVGDGTEKQIAITNTSQLRFYRTRMD